MILLQVNTDTPPRDLPSLPQAMLAVSAALEKKAEDVILLDISSVSIMADFFVICTARTDTHVRAVRDSVTQALERDGLNLRRREGADASGWVLLDWGDIVVHLFGPAEREFYSLEKLWGDARIFSYDAETP
ncbi:MAG: ribosome silencing factor [Bacillota bacterium]